MASCLQRVTVIKNPLFLQMTWKYWSCQHRVLLLKSWICWHFKVILFRLVFSIGLFHPAKPLQHILSPHQSNGSCHSLGPSWGFRDWLFCVLEWEADEEEEEVEEEDELRLVSTPVLVIFIFRRFASGALSTLLRKKPSRFPRLNACGNKEISWCKVFLESG